MADTHKSLQYDGAEKDGIIGVNVQELPSDVSERIIQDATLDEEANKKLLRRIDCFLLPLMCTTYGLQYVDKTSLSYGVVFGLSKDTHLHGNQYAFLTTIFYITFLAGQLPMAGIMQRMNVGRTLSVLCVIWGALVMCLAACNNFSQLSAVRALLGVAECAITPGFLLLVSSYYKRSEHVSRTLLWTLMNSVFSMIFGVAIYKLAEHTLTNATRQPWRVINLLLGGLTLVNGIVAFFFLGTPSEVRWLNPEQKVAAMARISSEGIGTMGSPDFTWTQVRETFKDPQYWAYALLSVIGTIPNGGLGTFRSLIIKSLGFTSLETVIMDLPSNGITIVTILICVVTVHFVPKARLFLIVTILAIDLIALLCVGLLPISHKWARWACYQLTGTGPVASFLTWSLIPTNIGGRTKKAIVSATVFIMYCLGNIIGSQVFRANDAPKYRTGLTVCACCFGAIIVLVTLKIYFVKENRRRTNGEDPLTNEELVKANAAANLQDLTDRQNKHFRYTL